MAIYDINGTSLDTAYDIDGVGLSTAYDIDGNVIFTDGEPPTPPTPTPTPDPYREGRVLAWEEDFNGESGLAPDATKWNHEVGSVRNPSWEKQYYTDGNLNSYLDGEGHLNIKAKLESIGSKNWSSASINTNNIYEFTYGRVEAKIKLPYKSGCVPAFWMLGSCLEVVPLGYYDSETQKDNEEKGILTPLTPEIDIVEQFGTKSTIQSAVHVGSEEGGNYEVQFMKTLTVEDATQWHVYSLEWTPTILRWYVDDVMVGESTTPRSYERLNKPMYMLLNIAVGTVNSSGGPGSSDKDMQVDWVRVYLPEGVLEKYPVTSVTLSEQSLSLSEGETSIIDFEFSPSLCWNKALVWESSNENIAKVYGGKVYAISAGTCTITATAHNGVSATCTVVVN